MEDALMLYTVLIFFLKKYFFSKQHDADS